MLAQLTAPGFAHVLCCHEAAHLFYFTMAGTKNFKPFPAKLVYDPAIDDYGGTLASVQVLDLPKPVQGKEWEWFETLAKAHAAGGVIARKLMPSLPNSGDLDDKERFTKLCESIKADNPNASIDPEDVWKKAQDAVLQDLTSRSDLLAKIEKFAEDELKSQLGLG
jgi:hypothetical protein